MTLIETVKQRVAVGQVWRQLRRNREWLWLAVTEPAEVVVWDGPDDTGTQWSHGVRRATFLSLDTGEVRDLDVDGVWASDSWELALAARAQMGNSSRSDDLELPPGSLQR